MADRNRPIAVLNRPFAVERTVNCMLPDGIFDVALHNLDICFFVTNVSSYLLRSVWVRSHPKTEWSYIGNNMRTFYHVPPGGSVLVRWPCNFANCTPGKKELEIEYGGQWDTPERHGFDGWVKQFIFVSKTTYDKNSRLYECTVPEGRLTVAFKGRTYIPSLPIRDSDGRQVSVKPIAVPVSAECTVISNPGEYDHLPFRDPWWKIIAWIVAAIAGIAAIIVAKEGEGTANVGITGEGGDDPTKYQWCVPDAKNHADGWSLAAFLSVLSTGAMRVGMMDRKDPWQKGRELLPYGPENRRVSEAVIASIQPPNLISAGIRYSVPIKWAYRADRGNGAFAETSADEVGAIENYLSRCEIDCPSSVRVNRTVVVRVYLILQDGFPALGRDIFGYALFKSPRGRVFSVELDDEGLSTGGNVNSGWFQARLELERLHLSPAEQIGTWLVDLYAQKTNNAELSMSALEAATHVGGDYLLGPSVIAQVQSTDQDHDKPHCEPDKHLSFTVA